MIFLFVFIPFISFFLVPEPQITFSGAPVNLSATLYSGTVFILTCVVDLGDSVDSPLSVLTTWSKNGSRIEDGRITPSNEAVNTSTIHIYESKLVFDPLSDSDDGNYSCSAEVRMTDFIVGNEASGVGTIEVAG